MAHVPTHPSAIKRRRQNLKHRARNRLIKSHVHSAVKHAGETIGAGDAAAAYQALRAAVRELAKAASKGTLHRNTIARRVARLATRYQRLHGAARSES